MAQHDMDSADLRDAYLADRENDAAHDNETLTDNDVWEIALILNSRRLEMATTLRKVQRLPRPVGDRDGERFYEAGVSAAKANLLNAERLYNRFTCDNRERILRGAGL